MVKPPALSTRSLDMSRFSISFLLLTLLFNSCHVCNCSEHARVFSEMLRAKDYDQAAGYMRVYAVDINTPISYGNPALHMAVIEDDMKTIEWLLENGADVDARNASLETPLHVAVLRGRKDIAELLMTKHADVNAVSRAGHTPLILAAMYDCVEIGALLLAHGALPTVTEPTGQTPHALATHFSFLDMAHIIEDPVA